jgi:hypothetical protein
VVAGVARWEIAKQARKQGSCSETGGNMIPSRRLLLFRPPSAQLGETGGFGIQGRDTRDTHHLRSTASGPALRMSLKTAHLPPAASLLQVALPGMKLKSELSQLTTVIFVLFSTS